MRILKMLELFARLSDTLLEVNAHISAKTTLFVIDGIHNKTVYGITPGVGSNVVIWLLTSSNLFWLIKITRVAVEALY
jgi:hypothetical protein